METRVLIVDDERKARELLVILLKQVAPDIEIVGLCSSIAESIPEIIAKKPDIIFLDVEMPDGSGLTLFNQSNIDFNFEVIFVTAYSEYAVDAFKVNALDYLLKPVSTESLQKAVEKAKSRLRNKVQGGGMDLRDQLRRLTEAPRIGFPTTNGVKFVEVNQIRRCEASSNYTVIYFLNGEKMVVSRTLKDLDDALKPYRFCRIHKSHMVRLNQITSYRKGENSAVTLMDGTTLPVSRPMRPDLENNLDIL